MVDKTQRLVGGNVGSGWYNVFVVGAGDVLYIGQKNVKTMLK